LRRGRFGDEYKMRRERPAPNCNSTETRAVSPNPNRKLADLPIPNRRTPNNARNGIDLLYSNGAPTDFSN
jgi:hypothetical protein